MRALATVDSAEVRRAPSIPAMLVKMLGTVWMTSFVLGMTGDPWLAAVVLVGYPAAWSAAWLVSP